MDTARLRGEEYDRDHGTFEDTVVFDEFEHLATMTNPLRALAAVEPNRPSLNCIFNGCFVASSADGIPLGAKAFVSLPAQE